MAGRRKEEQSGADHYSSEYKRQHLKGMAAQLKRDQFCDAHTVGTTLLSSAGRESIYDFYIAEVGFLKRMLGKVPKLFFNTIRN